VLPIQAVESSIEALLLAQGRGARVGLIRFSGNIALALAGSVLVWHWRSPTALAAGFVIANATKLVGGLISAPQLLRVKFPQRAAITGLLAESWPLYAAAVASFLYFRVDVFLVRALAGTRELGISAAGYRFIDAAILFPGAVAYAFFPGWVRNRADLREVFSVARLLVAVGASFAVAGAAAGPWLIATTLGPTYGESGDVLRILSLSLPVLFLDVILVWVAYALGRERAVILVGSAALCVNVGANALLIPMWGVQGAAVATVLSEVANLLGYLVVLRGELMSSARATPLGRRWLNERPAIP
jgi:O-antigen/teichoic acid export membrane protein